MEEKVFGCRATDMFHSILRNNKPIIVFGAGEIGYLVQRYFKRLGHPIALFIDNDIRKQGKSHCSTRILSPSEGVRQHPQGIFIIANLNAEHRQQMSEQLENGGVKKQIIICNLAMICEMKNNLFSQYRKEDHYFIYPDPMRVGCSYYCKKLKAKAKAARYKFLMNIVYPTTGAEKRYDVTICAIFKNEANYLKEWIEYHKIIGIQHFYLYNNSSEDCYTEVLEPYVLEKSVTLIDWPYSQGQMSAYRDCIKRYKNECRWIGFIDIDEFILPLRDNNVYSFLHDFEKNRGSVLIYWKVFGSAGKQDRDLRNLVTEDFTVCWEKHSDTGKCFFNTAYDLLEDDERNHVLHHEMWTEYRGIKFPPVNIFDRVCIDGFHSTNGKQFAIQVNHYSMKSYTEYQKKMQGTDVFFKENPHNELTFILNEEKCKAVDVSIYRYLSLLKQRMWTGG